MTTPKLWNLLKRSRFWRTELTVNGEETEMKRLTYECGRPCILIKYNGNTRVLCAIPSEVEAIIYGEERKSNARKLEAAYKAEKAYDAHCEMMRCAMDY